MEELSSFTDYSCFNFQKPFLTKRISRNVSFPISWQFCFEKLDFSWLKSFPLFWANRIYCNGIHALFPETIVQTGLVVTWLVIWSKNVSVWCQQYYLPGDDFRRAFHTTYLVLSVDPKRLGKTYICSYLILRRRRPDPRKSDLIQKPGPSSIEFPKCKTIKVPWSVP